MMDAWGIQAYVCCKVRDTIIRSTIVVWWLLLLNKDEDTRPPSPSRKIITTQWLSRVLHSTVTVVQEEELDDNRGFVGDMLVLHVESDNDVNGGSKKKIHSLVLKTSQPQYSSTRLAGLGGIREALYYNSKYAQRPMELGRIPKTYYSHGSRWLGEMVILMENLQESAPGFKQSVGVNQLMGNQIWGVAEDTPKTINKLELLKAMYYHAAEAHAQFWMDKSLLKESWMRNANWFHGGDRHYWEFSMEAARQGWEKIRTNTTALNYPEGFVEVLDASFAKSSWAKLQEHLKEVPFTLTHGDFHASNMIMQLKESSLHNSSNADDLLEGLKIFDWSEVGPWEPVTDLAQTVVSDLPKELFDQVEGVLKAYHVRLQELGVKEYVWEHCRQRFGESGMERWIWVLGAMSSLFDITSTGLGQYFVDQMDTFRQQFCPDHTHFVLKSCGYVLPARD